MRKPLLLFLIVILCAADPVGATNPSYTVDTDGILRSADGREVSFFGVNYTMPFAHAYRAADYIGFDRRSAIDRDVYHFARLGLNAYRIHIWDVEISDADGTLIENDHLDLLDYLIYKLDERGIKVLITAQTNFGNGYPERDKKTAGFSYLYEKCRVHSDSAAIASQQRYISQLLSHVNPYTGSAYKDEECIVGFEVNNEPCHADAPDQTREYIGAMLQAIAGTGNQKPIFYNVSHNMDHVGAYHGSAIDGTTYQWYPIGLVSGHTRQGNFLPYVDSYRIPFSNVQGFGNKAKAVYEFDAADIMYSYMYPAMARTFRSAGFQWMTQFAYDPIDMAAFNTEYQTHYLNLAYTPSKAISLMIAAQAAYSIPLYGEFPQYPADTLFNSFRVSYAEDLSEMNTPQKFFYSNTTATIPVDGARLEQVAGCGSSPVVSYEGTGAYFLDRIAEGVWRLEVMPDNIQIADPFSKTSLSRPVSAIKWGQWPMTVSIPGLGESFHIKGINKDNTLSSRAVGGEFDIRPGVYLLSARKTRIDGGREFRNMRIGEFVAPDENIKRFHITHTPQPFAQEGQTLIINARIAGPTRPDSVKIFSDRVSMWSQNNREATMYRVSGYDYAGQINDQWLGEGPLRYTITVFADGKATTWPSGTEGAPLDWDFHTDEYYTTRVVDPNAPVELLDAALPEQTVEVYALPQWGRARVSHPETAPDEYPALDFRFSGDEGRFYIRKYIKDITASRAQRTSRCSTLCISLGEVEGVGSIEAGFVDWHGTTYTAPADPISGNIARIPLNRLKQGNTELLPLPYPTFLSTEFVPAGETTFDIGRVETLLLRVSDSGKEASLGIRSIWLE